MKPKILVSRAVFPEVLARLAEHFDVESNPADIIYTQAELIAKLQGKDGLFANPADRISSELIQA